MKGVDNVIQISDCPSDADIERIVETYSNMLFKICFVMLCNEQDAEDTVQNTFFKYISKSPKFKDREHEKAWLIKVATNHCKDLRRFSSRHTHLSIEDIPNHYIIEKNADIIETLINLPQKYKTVIYLFYFESYTTKEISKMLSITSTAVRKRLQYGRNLLKIELEEEFYL